MFNDDMNVRHFSSAQQAREVLSREVLAQKLTNESQQWIEEISKDETKYNIEDFEEESGKKLAGKQEEIERIQKRIEELEAKAQTCELTPSEMAELEEKKGLIAGLVADFEDEQEAVQSEAKKRTSELQSDLNMAQKTGEAAADAGHDLINIANKEQTGWSVAFGFGRRSSGRSRMIGAMAVAIGNKLVNLVSGIAKKSESKLDVKTDVNSLSSVEAEEKTTEAGQGKKN